MNRQKGSAGVDPRRLDRAMYWRPSCCQSRRNNSRIAYFHDSWRNVVGTVLDVDVAERAGRRRDHWIALDAAGSAAGTAARRVRRSEGSATTRPASGGPPGCMARHRSDEAQYSNRKVSSRRCSDPGRGRCETCSRLFAVLSLGQPPLRGMREPNREQLRWTDRILSATTRKTRTPRSGTVRRAPLRHHHRASATARRRHSPPRSLTTQWPGHPN
jgi:hypothetical protein